MADSAAKLKPDHWYTVDLNWDFARRSCRVLLDGKPVAVLPQSRDSMGACYLRLKSTASPVDTHGFLIRSLSVEVSPTGTTRHADSGRRNDS